MTLLHFIWEAISMLLFVLMDLPRLIKCAAVRWRLPCHHKNVRYAPRPRGFCDVYDDVSSSASCNSVIVFIHGGAWAFGDKWIHADFCEDMMRAASCPVVAANYALWPQGDIHSATCDVADAIGQFLPAHQLARQLCLRTH
jgi:acetyl esterase/lipase